MEKRKSNILFLLHLPPPVHGSSIVGKSIVESAKINGAFECRTINLLVSRAIDETGKEGIIKSIRFIKVWLQLFYELIKQKPQLCYFALTASGAAFFKDVLLVILLRVFGIKTVYHLHNKGFSVNAESKIYSYFYKFVFKNSDVILLSKLLYDDVSSFVNWENVYICPNGIAEIRQKNKEQRAKTFEETTRNTNQRSSTKGDKPETRYVKLLFLSNLIESKGVYVLLEACKLLDKKSIDFSCSFIGGEGDITAKQLNEKIQLLGLENKVNYLGKKYGEEKNSYWQNADMFVFPTYYHNETFGLVNLEAMQNSLPVVSTFEGGIPDVVENGVTGFLVPQQDVQALADKLEVLIHNPELRIKIGAAGRKKYDEGFTLSKFENRIIEILKDIIKNNNEINV